MTRTHAPEDAELARRAALGPGSARPVEVEPAASVPAPAVPFAPSPRVTRAKALGNYGERLAARHLVAAGMALLDRNWRAPVGECVHGEIDLVLREGRQLVVCEVKTRSSVRSGTPHEAVDTDRAARLRMLGEAWLRAHAGLGSPEIRVDLVAVLRPLKGPSTLEHLRGIG